MNKNLEGIRKTIGEEAYARLLEVLKIFNDLKILDATLPESFDIYRKGDYWDNKPLLYTVDPEDINPEKLHVVPFSGSQENLSYIGTEDLDKIGSLEFSKYAQSISFTRNGYFYHWTRYNPTYEKMSISKDRRNNYDNNLSATLISEKEGLNSSRLTISGHYDLPTIYSYIDDVQVREVSNDGWGPDEVFEIKKPVSDYNTVFIRLLNEPRYQCLIPDSLQKQEIYAALLIVMKGAIDRVIFDMTLTDQSWRFAKEKEAIESDYESKKKKAVDEYEEACSEAARAKKYAIQSAQNERDRRLADISELEAEYKSQLKLAE